jgi:hypothetical protein
MSSASQLTIVIISYIGIIGLLISATLSIFVTYKRKKLLLLFLSFLFTGVLNFVYYSGVLFFVVGAIIVFFIFLLYLFVFQLEDFGDGESRDITGALEDSTKNKVFNIIKSVLLCSAAGYFIYIYAYDFLDAAKTKSGSGDISIAGWNDISGQIFAEYGLILIIVAASLFLTFLWFVAIGGRKK